MFELFKKTSKLDSFNEKEIVSNLKNSISKCFTNEALVSKIEFSKEQKHAALKYLLSQIPVRLKNALKDQNDSIVFGYFDLFADFGRADAGYSLQLYNSISGELFSIFRRMNIDVKNLLDKGISISVNELRVFSNK